MVLEQNVETIV
jgi:protein tyrosine phosphatase